MYHIIGLSIYIVMFFSIFYKRLKQNEYILFIFIFILFLLSSFRLNIGTDYQNYLNYFINVKPLTFHPDYSTNNVYFEPLFQLIVIIFKNVIISPLFYFSFFSFITLFFIWYGIRENSSNYLLSLFIFYCSFYHHYLFNTIRQGIAMGIFLVSIRYILKNEIYKVILLSIFAMLFHSSGFLIFIAYIMSKIQIKRRSLLLFYIFTSILIWKVGIGEIIFTYISSTFNNYIPNLVVYIRLFYFQHSFVNVLQRIFIIIPIILFLPKLSENSNFNKLFSIYFWSTIIYLLFGFFGLFITRINMFFRFIEILIIPLIYEKLTTNGQRFLFQFAIMCWGFTILTWLYKKEAYYPFKSIFGNII